MKEERIKILDLLSKGHITATIAESLLDAIDKRDDIAPLVKDTAFRQLVIEIKSSDGDDVNIKIPLEFAKLLKTKSFSSRLNEKDLNLDEIINLANSGILGEIINIETNDGDVIIIKVV